MRLLLAALLLVLIAATPLAAEVKPAGQRFVSIAFHDVADRGGELESDAVTSDVLAQFFDWLKGSGWTAVSLNDLAAAARGTRRLPDNAILITFDDGLRSLYTRVFPLLKLYGYPVVASLVGSWMDAAPDGTVLYGDRPVPRTAFISWEEAREMQASGLVEFASHSYGLHSGVLGNPQGNLLPAAIAWRYDRATQSYEDDAQYRARIRGDLARSRALMAAHLGRAPRALVWPFGRHTGPALQTARQLGFEFALTLDPEPSDTSDLYSINRYFPSRTPGLGEIARNLSFERDGPTTRRIACVTLDGLAAAGDGAGQDEALGHMIEGLRALGANIVIIDANAALIAPDAPLDAVFFPTPLRPLRADVLSRAAWQIRTRAGVDVFLHLPIGSAAAAVGATHVPALFADMARHAPATGIVIDAPAPLAPATVIPDLPEDIRHRRAALDPAALDSQTRLGLAAYREAATIDPRLRLMVALREFTGPPDWADIGLLPPVADAPQAAALAGRLRAAGWLRPDVAGRVALSLPARPEEQVEAVRSAQRRGVSALALCPEPPLPPATALSAAFSSATYPYRP
ncbi:MAG TPA: poly-beta-1,6-N-acetyl-D-glucosamine N-deacetylase PgaB [Alphaproteobacteria bacterium]|nr:poly-beta-1,6-N-acetyl-D-glucosamine N-deacetylase PgaB [Alphaproteobacteria bacterium]